MYVFKFGIHFIHYLKGKNLYYGNFNPRDISLEHFKPKKVAKRI